LTCVERCQFGPSPWGSPDPLFIKPPFRELPNEGVKKKLQAPKPPLLWVRVRAKVG